MNVQVGTRQHAATFFPALDGDLPLVTRAEGVYLFDDRGRRFIDAAGGVGAVTSVGHAVPEIVDAIAHQMRTVAFVPWTQFQTEPAQKLAEAIAETTPRGLNNVALFTSGSEVTEGAVKLARQYWVARGQSDKHLVISRWQGFHGLTLGASGFSGHTQRRRKYQPMLHDMPKISPAYAYRCEDCARGSLRCADELERMIRWFGPENVSCFIAEPVVGATMGAVPAPPGYFQRIREICDRYDVLFIADEVMTGFGRTGRWFAIEHWDVVPDIVVAAKGVSGGYVPLAILAAHERVVNALREAGSPWVAGHTYAQNPLAAAGGLAVLEYIQRHDLVRAASSRGSQLLDGLRGLIPRHRILGDARGLGLLLGVELVQDRTTRVPFPLETGMAYQFARACIEEGAAVYPGQSGADGQLGDHALVTPPMTITSEQVAELIGAIDRALTRVETMGA
ncbi:MAG TPA: aminotransferase class III-fold pyridoxal phosphate-dependent enzyme [Chloroflexota bacterium]|nr:aminotransferase class III-fold pyridoxal phosphate-dependent enzyme [Chloroflexota bacterium]